MLRETVRPDGPVDEIADGSLRYAEEKPRMADDHGRHRGEFAQEPRRRPDRLPWRPGAWRVKICRYDRIEVDRYQLLRVQAEPAKPHPTLATIEPPGLDKDFERYPLRPGRIT